MRHSWLQVSCTAVLCTVGWGCGEKSAAPPVGGIPVSPPTQVDRSSEGSQEDSYAGERGAKTPIRVGEVVAAQEQPKDTASSDDASPPKGLLGKWLLNIADGSTISQFWMIEITGGEDAYETKVVDSVARAKSSIRDFKKADDHVSFELMLDEQALSFDGVVVGERVQGSLDVKGQPSMAWLQRTKQKTLRGGQTTQPASGGKEFEATQQTEDPKQQVKLLLQFVDQHPESTFVFDAIRNVLRKSKEAEISEEDLRGLIEKYQAWGQQWGRRLSLSVLESIAYDLGTADAHPAIALEYAQKTTKALGEDASMLQKYSAQLTLAIAELRNGNAQESKKLLDDLNEKDPDNIESRYYHALADEKLGEVDAAIDSLAELWPQPLVTRELERLWKDKNGSLAGLEERLDGVYLKRFPPIAVETFAGREDAANDQVVLAELFTGTSATPCVAVDVAFDALGRAFKRTELVLLQYHLQVPGPDPLTNPDSEARAAYYHARGTPLMLINGKEVAPGGGSRQVGLQKYMEYRSEIEKQLSQMSPAKIELRGTRQGDQLDINVKLSDVAEPGEKLRLRLAIVEEMVRFTGFNGLRLHHEVVRGLPGGPEGVAVTEANMIIRESVDIAKLKVSLADSLANLEKQHGEFPGKPLELNHLGVAAILQDDATQTVVQAAFVSLEPEAKAGE